MNSRKLKAKCVEQGITISQLCASIGMSTATFYRRIERNTITINNVMMMTDVLNLNAEEVLEIFLPL